MRRVRWGARCKQLDFAPATGRFGQVAFDPIVGEYPGNEYESSSIFQLYVILVSPPAFVDSLAGAFDIRHAFTGMRDADGLAGKKFNQPLMHI